MPPSPWLIGLCLLGQVSPPLLGNDTAQARSRPASGITHEAAELYRLAEQLTHLGQDQAVSQVRGLLFPRPAPPDRAHATDAAARGCRARFRRQGSARRQGSLRSGTEPPRERFELAQHTAKAESPQYALASVCLREVLERQPDHKEARRLLGYVPHRGGWARPFAVDSSRKRNMDHPIFGWVARGLGAASRPRRVARAGCPAAEEGAVALRPRRQTGSEPIGIPPGSLRPSISRSRRMCPSPRRSLSAAGSRPFTTCS